jgi:hypothetical protein
LTESQKNGLGVLGCSLCRGGQREFPFIGHPETPSDEEASQFSSGKGWEISGCGTSPASLIADITALFDLPFTGNERVPSISKVIEESALPSG